MSMDFASIWVILKLVGLASPRLSSPSLGSLAVLTSLGSLAVLTSLGSALARTTTKSIYEKNETQLPRSPLVSLVDGSDDEDVEDDHNAARHDPHEDEVGEENVVLWEDDKNG